MKINFRRIGQFCLLLVIIGFCCPIACDNNGFQIANDAAGPDLKGALYVLFIFAIIGVVIGLILMANKKIPIIVDWLVTLTCMGCGLIPFFANINEWGRYYQAGAYLILVGVILSFVFLLIASFTGDTDSSNASTNRRSYSPNKRCRQCNTLYSGAESSCPKCGSSLYEEAQDSMINSNRNYGDTWVCKKCNERNPITSSSCKSCGGYR